MFLLLLQLAVELSIKPQASARATPVSLNDNGKRMWLSLCRRGVSVVQCVAVAAQGVIVRHLLFLQLPVQFFLKILAPCHAAPVSLDTNSV